METARLALSDKGSARTIHDVRSRQKAAPQMMIVTCPVCSTRYHLDPSLLTEEGHRVRCTECGEVWFQEPEQAEAASEPEKAESAQNPPSPPSSPREPPQKQEEESFYEILDSIPESVRPDPGSSVLPQARSAPRKVAFATGALASLLLFTVIFVGIATQRDRIVMRWPPAALVFDALGLSFHLPGQSMTLEGLKAEIVGDPQSGLHLTLSGRIINLKSMPIVLVPLRVEALRAGDAEGEEWVYEFPERTLRAESELPFGPSWPVAEGGNYAVTVRPDPFAKISADTP